MFRKRPKGAHPAESIVPGADKYLAKARKLGLFDKAIENKDGLNAALTKLGIPKDTSAQFVTAVTDWIGRAGGDSVKELMSGLVQ
jgi:hypothetical protein